MTRNWPSTNIRRLIQLIQWTVMKFWVLTTWLVPRSRDRFNPWREVKSIKFIQMKCNRIATGRSIRDVKDRLEIRCSQLVIGRYTWNSHIVNRTLNQSISQSISQDFLIDHWSGKMRPTSETKRLNVLVLCVGVHQRWRSAVLPTWNQPNPWNPWNPWSP